MNVGSLFGRRESALARSVTTEKMMGEGQEPGIDGAELLRATAIGAGVGAGVGLVAGMVKSNAAVNAVPKETVTLTWKEPVTRETTIGHIPRDQYFPASRWFFNDCEDDLFSLCRPRVNPDLRATEPVNRQTPVLDGSGNPVYREVTRTFSDHGKATVHTHSQTVKTPRFDGYDQRNIDDTHWERKYDGRDAQGNDEYRSVRILDGVKVRFSPKVSEQPINRPEANYETKSVSFDHGIAVGSIILRSTLIGAGVGAVVGLVGDLAKQALDKRSA